MYKNKKQESRIVISRSLQNGSLLLTCSGFVFIVLDLFRQGNFAII